jgi:catechol 2,3-dioxygenase-like lactoylglutathione lyase family enzyme
MTLGLNHLTLAVSDVTRSVHFYVHVVGCTKVATWNSGAYLRAGNTWLCLSKDVGVPGATRGDYSHAAFSYDALSIEALRNRLHASGVVLWKENSSEGDSVYFLDPDGHKLEGHVGSLQTRLASLRTAPYAGLEIHEDDV